MSGQSSRNSSRGRGYQGINARTNPENPGDNPPPLGYRGKRFNPPGEFMACHHCHSTEHIVRDCPAAKERKRIHNLHKIQDSDLAAASAAIASSPQPSIGTPSPAGGPSREVDAVDAVIQAVTGGQQTSVPSGGPKGSIRRGGLGASQDAPSTPVQQSTSQLLEIPPSDQPQQPQVRPQQFLQSDRRGRGQGDNPARRAVDRPPADNLWKNFDPTADARKTAEATRQLAEQRALTGEPEPSTTFNQSWTARDREGNLAAPIDSKVVIREDAPIDLSATASVSASDPVRTAKSVVPFTATAMTSWADEMDEHYKTIQATSLVQPDPVTSVPAAIITGAAATVKLNPFAPAFTSRIPSNESSPVSTPVAETPMSLTTRMRAPPIRSLGDEPSKIRTEPGFDAWGDPIVNRSPMPESMWANQDNIGPAAETQTPSHRSFSLKSSREEQAAENTAAGQRQLDRIAAWERGDLETKKRDPEAAVATIPVTAHGSEQQTVFVAAPIEAVVDAPETKTARERKGSVSKPPSTPAQVLTSVVDPIAISTLKSKPVNLQVASTPDSSSVPAPAPESARYVTSTSTPVFSTQGKPLLLGHHAVMQPASASPVAVLSPAISVPIIATTASSPASTTFTPVASSKEPAGKLSKRQVQRVRDEELRRNGLAIGARLRQQAEAEAVDKEAVAKQTAEKEAATRKAAANQAALKDVTDSREITAKAALAEIEAQTASPTRAANPPINETEYQPAKNEVGSKTLRRQRTNESQAELTQTINTQMTSQRERVVELEANLESSEEPRLKNEEEYENREAELSNEVVSLQSQIERVQREAEESIQHEKDINSTALQHHREAIERLKQQNTRMIEQKTTNLMQMARGSREWIERKVRDIEVENGVLKQSLAEAITTREGTAAALQDLVSSSSGLSEQLDKKDEEIRKCKERLATLESDVDEKSKNDDYPGELAKVKTQLDATLKKLQLTSGSTKRSHAWDCCRILQWLLLAMVIPIAISCYSDRLWCPVPTQSPEIKHTALASAYEIGSELYRLSIPSGNGTATQATYSSGYVSPVLFGESNCSNFLRIQEKVLSRLKDHETSALTELYYTLLPQLHEVVLSDNLTATTVVQFHNKLQLTEAGFLSLDADIDDILSDLSNGYKSCDIDPVFNHALAPTRRWLALDSALQRSQRGHRALLRQLETTTADFWVIAQEELDVPQLGKAAQVAKLTDDYARIWELI